MSDEAHTLKRIDFRSAFPLTLIFRSFRVAIHPSKIVLALLAMFSLYVGGRVLDGLWPNSRQAVPHELRLYEQARGDANPARAFDRLRDEQRRAGGEALAGLLRAAGKPDGSLRDLRARILEDRQAAVLAAGERYRNSDKTDDDAAARDRAIAAETARAQQRWRDAMDTQPVGLFDQFTSYQIGQINAVARALRRANWFGDDGVVDAVTRFCIVGPSWAFGNYPVFFAILAAYFLCVWSIFGGAIARIAAVHLTRDEKISIRQALVFSTSKFFSFLSAPLIPLLLILGIGVVVALGGLVGNIPVVGPLAIALTFAAALVAGFLMALVLIGLAGGFNLMYPTIAVEGSDSFDAISRSFSYLYARPWRLGLFTAVAVVYGGICYSFVRFFIYVMLSLTHAAAGALLLRTTDTGQPLLDALWPSPLTNGQLTYDLEHLAMSTSQSLSASILSVWIYLAIGVLGAFAISFYFSAHTAIYLLMRHEVDATEMDEVYLEQSDETFEEAPVAIAAEGTEGVAPSGDAAPPQA